MPRREHAMPSQRQKAPKEACMAPAVGQSMRAGQPLYMEEGQIVFILAFI